MFKNKSIGNLNHTSSNVWSSHGISHINSTEQIKELYKER